MLECDYFKVIKKVGFFKPGDVIQVSQEAKVNVGDYCIFKKDGKTTLKKYKGKGEEFIFGRVIKIQRDLPYTPLYTTKN